MIERVRDIYIVFMIWILSVVFFSGAAEAQQISVADECRVKCASDLSFISHRMPTKFNVRVGAYYYWRVVFAEVTSDEYYSRNSGNHTFELKRVPPPSKDLTPYQVRIQRRFYSWEDWTDYSSDINRYFVDDMLPQLNTWMQPYQGTTVDGNVTFKWDFLDIGCGLHMTAPFHMVLKNSGGDVIYDSGWMSYSSYTSPSTLDVGSYSWMISARDNDENTVTEGPNYFKVGTSQQPQIYRIGIRNSLGEDNNNTNSRSVYIVVGAFDEYKLAAYHISESPAFPAVNDANWKYISPSKNFEDSVPFELGSGDGNKEVFVCFKGVSGNVSNIRSVKVVLDSVPPSAANARINDGALYTAKRQVVLDMSSADNVGVYSYTVRETQDDPLPNDYGWIKLYEGGLKNVSKKIEYTLTSEESIKTLYVWFRDAAGNIKAAPPQSIRYTLHPPLEAIAGGLGLKGGYSLVNTREITLELSAAGSKTLDVTGYYLAEYPFGTVAPKPSPDDFRWTAITPAQSFNALVDFKLSVYDGTHEIYAWYKDGAGNVSDAVKCAVAFDTLRPSGTVSIKTADFNGWVNSEIVTLEIKASDSQGISGYMASAKPDKPSAFDSRWTDVPLTKSFSEDIIYSLGSVNEEKKIFVFYKDGAGNVSDPVSTSVMLDTVPPTAGTEEATVITIAGSYEGKREGGYRDGQGLSALFSTPAAVDIGPDGNIYVADADNYRVRKITRPDFMVSTFAGNGAGDDEKALVEYRPQLSNPIGHVSKVVFDRLGNMYSNTYRCARISVNGMSKRVFGSYGNNQKIGNGPALDIHVETLSAITCDGSGDLFVVDASNFIILKVDMKSQMSSIYAGVPRTSIAGGLNDGYRTSTPIGSVSDICIDRCDNLYYVDGSNYLVKKIGPDGYIKTICGCERQRVDSTKMSTTYPATEGFGSKAFFNVPYGIAVDYCGNLYVAELGGCCVRKITPNGFASIIAGKGYKLSDADKTDMDGIGRDAIFDGLQGLAVDNSGTIFLADSTRHKIKMITTRQTAYLEASKINKTNGEVTVKIFTTDNFSGVKSYMISENPDPPLASSSGWINFRERDEEFVYTAEVKIKLKDPSKESVVYAWYKDKAENVSSRSSITVNKKNMKSAGSIGNSSNISSPYALALVNDKEILFCDKSDPPVGRIDSTGSIERLCSSEKQIDRLSPDLGGIASLAEGYFGVLEKDKN
ncbi:MAG TPA: hypothetical protein PKK26_02385 [Candidatus Wallbacteria bacterium]|nr:hypothetical protein [Candidatus Wallbacteria bacterium]